MDPKCGAGRRRGGKEQVEEVKLIQAAACDEALRRLASVNFAAETDCLFGETLITSSFRPQGHGQNRRKPDVRVLEIKCVAGSKDAERVDWILVERKEELERDPRTNEVHRGKISVFYWDLSAGTASDIPDGEFLGFYDKGFDDISITSSSLSTGGYVRVDPPRLRGGRLGTYLMNEVVGWAKQWPDTPVREVTLLASDAGDPQNRLRRNRFYEGFGLEFDFTDKDKSAGIPSVLYASFVQFSNPW